MQDGGARSQDEREVLRDELRLHVAKATSVADTAFPAQNPGQNRGPSRNWQKAWGPFLSLHLRHHVPSCPDQPRGLHSGPGYCPWPGPPSLPLVDKVELGLP